MRNTPYKGYALYEPDASPDLTESGEYNTALMAVDADMHGEEQARIEGDAALNIAIANEMAQRRAADDALNKRIDTETAERKAADTALDAAYKAADAALDTAYKAADTALGKRIDNAEAEISANSADLTGIKSLTYGDAHVNFLENSNGEYSSPAFEEIKHEIETRGFRVFDYDNLPDNAFTALSEAWPMCCIYKAPVLVFPSTKTNASLKFTNVSALTSDPLTASVSSVTVNSDGTKSLARYIDESTQTIHLTGTIDPNAYSLAQTSPNRIVVEYNGIYLHGSFISQTITSYSAINISELSSADENDETTQVYAHQIYFERAAANVHKLDPCKLVPYKYFTFSHLKGKPFSTIGTGLKVVDDALTVDTSALPSALTIMQLSEFGELTDNTSTTHSATGDGNATAYAKLKQAWPSVIVVEGGTSWRCGMYTPSNVEQAGYILVKSANITGSAIQMRIHGGGFPGAITLEEIGG